jgi:hypothetical protein
MDEKIRTKTDEIVYKNKEINGGELIMNKKDTHYIVTWEIDIWALSPKKAAKEALKIMQDKESAATIFSVRRLLTSKSHLIDLAELSNYKYL